MKKVIHKADTRGHSQYDWLDSYHTFSFDEYFDSDRINFGALRVLNDDKVAPGEGFQTHPNKNMEIISIPLKDICNMVTARKTAVSSLSERFRR